jgi:hypothetical protein
VTDTLASVVSISKPSVEYVDGIIEKIKKRIRSKGEDILDKIMLTAFEQYRQDKNRQKAKPTTSISSTAVT